MDAVQALVAALQHLVTTTARVWWRTLPRLLVPVMLGWLGYRVLAQLAALAVEISAWLSLLLLALGFVASLSAIVISLRIVGQQLRVREAVPLADDDPRDTSVAHLLSLTLLPFLGIYAVFDVMTDAANALQVNYWVFHGLTIERQVLSQFDPRAEGNNPWVLVGAIVGLYLVRRLIDLVFARTGYRPLGLLSALVEGFFLLLVVLSGRQVAVMIAQWVDGRQFRVWLDYPGWGLQQLFGRFGVDISGVLDALSSVWTETLGPGLTAMVLEPMLWLSVAALVFGSQVLSVADLWRRGKDVGVAARRTRVAVGDRGRALTLQVQEAFFGDLNDKYLPTFQSLRLVLGVGATFLGAFVIAYGALSLLDSWLTRAILSTLGGHRAPFWAVVNPPIDLLVRLVVDPLRWALLATAFQSCLVAFHARADEATAAESATHEAATTPPTTSAEATPVEVAP